MNKDPLLMKQLHYTLLNKTNIIFLFKKLSCFLGSKFNVLLDVVQFSTKCPSCALCTKTHLPSHYQVMCLVLQQCKPSQHRYAYAMLCKNKNPNSHNMPQSRHTFFFLVASCLWNLELSFVINDIHSHLARMPSLITYESWTLKITQILNKRNCKSLELQLDWSHP